MRILKAARAMATVLTVTWLSALPLLVAGQTPPAFAQSEPAPENLQAAKDLLKATNAEAQFAAMIPLIFNQLRQILPQPGPNDQQVFDQVFAEIQKQAIARSSELIDQIAALYAKRFTVEELTAVSQFYRSPVGQKFVAATPDITGQSMRIGNAWGRKIGQEAEQTIRSELLKRGIKL